MEFLYYQDPLCIACGAIVGFEEYYAFEWLCCEPMMVPKNPTTWNSIYRLILKPDTHSPYRLSSVGRMDFMDGQLLDVPLERDTIRVDHSERWEDFPEQTPVANFMDSRNQDAEPHGYLIHANCWRFIERVIGPRAEQHLGLFLQALRIRWEENPFELSEFQGYDEEMPESGSPGSWQGKVHDWDDVAIFHKNKSEDEWACYRKLCKFLARDIPPVWDPLDILPVRDILQKSVANRARESTKRKTRKWCSLPCPPIDHLRAQGCNLPPEIKWHILDHLHYKDVRSALTAFGWQIADTYWRVRSPRDIIFEIKDLDSTVDVDWKYLCLKMEELLETSQSLMNRQRIIRVLEGTKKVFLAMSEDD